MSEAFLKLSNTFVLVRLAEPQKLPYFWLCGVLGAKLWWINQKLEKHFLTENSSVGIRTGDDH